LNGLPCREAETGRKKNKSSRMQRMKRIERIRHKKFFLILFILSNPLNP